MRSSVCNRVSKGDCTPLMEAAHGGHIEIVRLLIQHGADVNARTSSGNSPLMFGCAKGSVDVVSALLDAGAKVEVHNENGHTPLMEAASAGHVEVAKLLLSHGAGINTHSNEFKESALTLACYKGHYDMVKFLLEAGADQEHKTDEMHTALMEACMDGHVKVARLLLDSGAQVNMPADSFESPLTLAACGGHVDLAMLLLERGANIEEVNDEGYTPLMEAAREGHEEMVALLLSQDRCFVGAEINAQTEETLETALTLACCGGFLEVTKFLITAGADIELGASTPLMEAAQEGHLKLVRYLLEHRANVHAQTQTLDTALTYACENGHTEVAKLLLDYNSDLEHKSEGGRTPLMKAARAGHLGTVQFLTSKGANINSQTTNNDHTPLSLACASGNTSVVEWLLKHGADPLHKLKDNSTMLIESAKGGHTEVVELLIDWSGEFATSLSSNEDAKEFERYGAKNELLKSSERKMKRLCTPHLSSILDFTSIYDELSDITELADFGISSTSEVVEEFDNYLKSLVNGNNDEQYIFKEKASDSLKMHDKAPQEFRANNISSSDSCSLGLRQNCTAEDLSISPSNESMREVEKNPLENNCMEESQMSSYLAGVSIVCSDTMHSPVADQKNQIRDTVIIDIVNNSSNKGVGLKPKASNKKGQKVKSVLQPTKLKSRANNAMDGLPTGSTLRFLSQIQEQFSGGDQSNDATLKKFIDFGIQEESNLSNPSSIEDESEDVPYGPENLCNSLYELTQDPTALVKLPGEKLINSPTQWQLEQNLIISGVNGNPLDSPIHLSDKEDDYDGRSDTTEEMNYQSYTPINKIEIYGDHSAAVCENLVSQNDINRACVCKTSEYPSFSKSCIDETDVESSEIIPDINCTLSNPSSNQLFSDDTQIQYQTCFSPENDCLGSGYHGDSSITGLEKLNVDMQKVQSIASSNQNLSATASLGLLSQSDRTAIEINSLDEETSQFVPIPVTMAAATAPLMTGPVTSFAHNAPLDNGLMVAAPARELHETLGNSHFQSAVDSNQYNQQGIPPPRPFLDLECETESNHDTALTLACAGGHEDLVRLLINRGADIEHRDKKGYTPLMLAATAGHVGVVEILLANAANSEAQSDRTKDTALSLACSSGRIEVVETLLRLVANKEHRNLSDYTPLSLAASGGYVNIIRLLLNYGAEINSRTGSKLGISPLMLAAMNGHNAAAKVLLDEGSDINAEIETNKNTALTLACFQGRSEVVATLLQYNANVEHRAKTGLTPLMEAASGGFTEVGKVLLEYGADVNAPPVPSSRDTALTIAADKGHYKFVQLLLDNGAQVDVKNKKGNSPVWLAASGGYLDVIQLLSSANADLDSIDNRNVSCLMAACRNGHMKPVKYLVKHVTQFPSDLELSRYLSTITDPDEKKRCSQCMDIIKNAKERQEAEANKNAEILLEEIDKEKTREESKKLAAQRKRQKKKQKKQQKKIEKKKLAAGTENFPDANDIEADVKSEVMEEAEEKLTCDDVPDEDTMIESEVQLVSDVESKSVIEKELPDSGVEFSSLNSSPSEIKEVQVLNDNNSNKEGKRLKQDTSNKNVPKPTTQSKMTLKNVALLKSDKLVSFTDVTEIESKERAVKNFKRKRSRLANSSNHLDNSSQLSKRNENTEDLNPIRHDQIRAANNLNKPIAVSKNSRHKRDDDWKEVARRTRKVMVPANTISRVIGRNGTNINTIRDISGAHIEIEKQIKGHTDRSILIRGSPEAIKHASRLISELVADLDRDVADLIPRSMEKSTYSSTLIFTRSNSVATTSVGNLSGSQTKPKIVPGASQIGNSSLPVKSTIGLITGSQWWQPSSKKSQSKSSPPSATAITDKDSGELSNPGAPSIPSLTSSNPVIPSCSQVEVTMSENKDSEVTKEWIKEKEEMKRGMDFASVAATGLLSQASSNVKTTPCHSSSSFDASKAPGYRGIFSSISNLMSSDMDLNMPYEFVPPYSNQITSLSHIGNTSASLTNTPVSVPIRVHNQAITPLFTTPKVSPCSTRVPTVVSQSLLTSCGYYPRILPTTSSFSAQSAPKVIVTCREAIVTRNVVSSAYGNSTISSLISSFSREFSTPLCGRGVVFSNPVSSSRGTLLAGTDSQRSEFEFETSSQPNNPISTYTTASLPQLVSSTGPIQSKLNPNAPDFSVRISNYAPSESQSVVPDESNINVNSDTAAVGGRNTYVKLPYPMPAPGYVMGHNPYGTNMEKMNYKDNESQQPSSYFTSTSTDLLNEECPPLLSDSIRDLVVPRLIGMERGLVTNQDSSYNQQFWPATDMYNSNISNPPPSEWSSYENHSKQVDYTDADSNDKEKTISRGKRTNKILFLKGVKNIKQVPAHYISDTSRENHPSNAADAGQTKFSSWGRPRRH